MTITKWMKDFHFYGLGFKLWEGWRKGILICCVLQRDVDFDLHKTHFLITHRTDIHICNIKRVFSCCHECDLASIILIVPSGRRFCVYFKHSAVFAISDMGVRGGILLRAWILMGFLSEKTAPARITHFTAIAFPVTEHSHTVKLFHGRDCFSAVSAFLDNASTKAQAQLFVCILDLLYLAEKTKSYFMLLAISWDYSIIFQ